MPDDSALPAQIDTGVIGSGSTSGTLVTSTDKFLFGFVGLQITFLTGTYAGQSATIQSVTNKTKKQDNQASYNKRQFWTYKRLYGAGIKKHKTTNKNNNSVDKEKSVRLDNLVRNLEA